MDASGKFCRRSSSPEVFKPDVYRLKQYLDLGTEVYFHSSRATGIQTFRNVITANPGNFSQLSYLDLDGGYYFKTIAWKDVKNCLFQQKVKEMKEDVIFRGHIVASFYRAKHQAKMDKFYLQYAMSGTFICPILDAFFNGLDFRMQTLLEFGVQRIPTSRLVYVYRYFGGHPYYQMGCVLENINYYYLKILLPDPRMDAYCIHRLLLIIEVAYILCKSHNNPRENWRNCYRLLWRSIPDAYLSVNEIWKAMTYLKARNYSIQRMRRMCRFYIKSFPDMIVHSVQPRSLLHSCRCVIRYYMRLNHSLPLGIDRLQIARRLKLYLKLEF